jgi:NADH-quinone oxidoreductase subunit C
MSLPNDLVTTLTGMGIDARETDYQVLGWHVEASLNPDQVRPMAQTLLNQGFYLVFVTAVHVNPGFQVVYQFAHTDQPCRVNLKAMALEDGTIPTISDIYQGASWHERETHDFYGLAFTGNPDLRTLLLCEEDHDLKPLLKSEGKLKDIEGITRMAALTNEPNVTTSPE